ncbi:hypothetical protein [Sedimenticola selenatireducens]|uniref:hypothetical protein n=1 Tax=Sedimenticola selenatireducens TaxID=191960 RepID=UPI0004B5D0E0|nr:hypothetical protein [Sedimenticola selenatireducens]
MTPQKKQVSKKKVVKKKVTRKSAAQSKQRAQKQISSQDLPKKSLQDALSIAKTINDHYAGKNASWEDIAKAMEFSAKNPNNKYLLWSASAYGIIHSDESGTYKISETGRKILSPTYEGEDREGKVKAIAAPKILAQFYSDYSGSKLPNGEIFKNVLEQKYHVPKARVDETIQLILSNARFAGMLDESDENAFALRSSNAAVGIGSEDNQTSDVTYTDTTSSLADLTESDYSKACFIITPIGDEGSDQRKHADAMLKHLITPVLKEAGIDVVRADNISKPGHVTKQVVEHIAYSRLCITDLSFGNQNAHYELGIRHAFKLPSIQIIRKGDKIPFDVQQGRTIIIDTSDPYTIMDRIASARAELTEHVRALLDSKEKTDESPVSMYLPKLTVKMG